jgi:hypothetical protein
MVRNPSEVSFIKDEVMPHVVDFWSKSIEVRRAKGPLTVRRNFNFEFTAPKEAKTLCSASGGIDVTIPKHILGKAKIGKKAPHGGLLYETLPAGPGAEVDLFLIVTMDDIGGCGDGFSGTLAYAFSCRFDECDRPVVANVNICPRAIDVSSAKAKTKLVGTINHELTHALGFSYYNFSRFRHPHGLARANHKRTILYDCEIIGGKPKVRWDVSVVGSNTRSFTFPDGVVSVINQRKVGSKCTCPTDALRTYTSSEIENCLMNKHECIYAITTPKVVAVAKAFYGCDSVKGAELENHPPSLGCGIIESHWKQSMIGNELMMQYSSAEWEFISPMTFALLEDSGWYKMNYDMTTALVPGMFWGYKAGCDFVNQPCFKNGKPTKTEHTDKMFCDGSQFFGCSTHALGKAYCSTSNHLTVPDTYQYGLNSNLPSMDYCPVFDARYAPSCDQDGLGSSSEIYGEGSRCLVMNGAGSCMGIKCYEDGKEYSVTLKQEGVPVEVSQRCTSKNQKIQYKSQSITCEDPSIICAKLFTPQLIGEVWKAPPGGVQKINSHHETKTIIKDVGYTYSLADTQDAKDQEKAAAAEDKLNKEEEQKEATQTSFALTFSRGTALLIVFYGLSFYYCYGSPKSSKQKVHSAKADLSRFLQRIRFIHQRD